MILRGAIPWLTFTTTVFVVFGLVQRAGVQKTTSADVPLHRERDTIGIEEVVVEARQPDAEEKYLQKVAEFRKIYLYGDNKNMFQYLIFPPIAVLNINKLYNHFSNSGKRARRLQRYFEAEYVQDKIQEIWHPLTRQYTGLQGQELEDFQRYYQPTLEWLTTAGEYDRLEYIATRLKYYSDSATYIRSFLQLPYASEPR